LPYPRKVDKITRMDYKISASLACADPLCIQKDFDKLEKSCIDAYHIDLCDGVFAPTFLLNTAIVKALRPLTNKRLDVHIYGHYPGMYVEDLQSCGADVVVVHLEAQGDDYRDVVRQIRRHGMQAGIAVLPTSAICAEVKEVLPLVSVAVANSVGPAYFGQPFNPAGLQNMALLRQYAAEAGCQIEIIADGSVSAARLPAFLEAGANHFVLGTAGLFMDEHLQENAAKFRQQLAAQTSTATA